MADPLRLASGLREGDLVRLVSPASYPDRASVDHCVRALSRWGLRVEVAPHVFDEWGYMAGSDESRLDDLNEAFRDPKIRAVVATRGGAGAYRIADRLDFAAVSTDPKPLVGFSNITYLHLSLVGRSAVGVVHGCLVGAQAQDSARQLLMTPDPIVLYRVPGAVLSDVDIPGRAEGRLVGGNLASVATSIGVRMPAMSGSILFLEDQRVVGLGTIDRQLTQLISSGALDGIVGVALGSFEGFRGFTDRGWQLSDVFADRLGLLGVPVLGGLYAGHDLTGSDGGPDQTCLPLGSLATLDTEAGTLTSNPIVY